jgi:DNA (cytosine-5)-methyltransferase 1
VTPLFPQLLLDVHPELIVDLFAGGGGASLGIEMATGRQVDVAINHDAVAVSLHAANHPQTKHLVSDVFEVDPRAVTGGRPIGLLWASPDCTFHSKARGAKPFRSKETKRRALAWVVTRWAGQVRPRVIMLENVEEFAQWGPLVGPRDAQRPDPRRRGATFRAWVRSLTRLGYQVEHRELRACDYGAPTIRKRLFLIARCDGQPIVWPEPTHGPRGRLPYRTAAECIDWSIPMLSIFATREEAKVWGREHGVPTPVRPLADATMRRIARGVKRFVLDNPRPFIVSLAHGESHGRREYPMTDPIGTQHSGGNKFGVVAPVLVRNQTGEQTQPARSLEEPLGAALACRANPYLAAPMLIPRYGERDGQEPRVRSIEEPAPVIVPTGNGGSLAAAFLAKHFGDTGQRPGSDLREPVSTVTACDHNALVAAHLVHQYTSNLSGAGGDLERPLKTVTTGGHHALVASFLSKYYGQGVGAELQQPAPTTTTKDRSALVTVTIAGEPYVVADIAMRMLQPRELYSAQGFHPGYVIDRGADGRRLTKTEQVRMVGNSVCPPMAAALVRANAPGLVVRDEVAA